MSDLNGLRSNGRVEIVDDERSIGNGIIVTLRKGFTFSLGEDNRVSGEDTPARMMTAVRSSHMHPGPYDA